MESVFRHIHNVFDTSTNSTARLPDCLSAFTFKRSGRDSNPAPASSARCHRDLSSPVQSCHNSTGCSGGDPVFRSADHLLWLHASSGFHHQPADRVSIEGFPDSLTTSPVCTGRPCSTFPVAALRGSRSGPTGPGCSFSRLDSLRP